MKLEHIEVKNIIKQTISEYMGIQIEDDDRHLLCSDYGIVIADFLYVFRELEKHFRFPAAKVLEKRDYTVFTVNNLATAICEDCPSRC